MMSTLVMLAALSVGQYPPHHHGSDYRPSYPGYYNGYGYQNGYRYNNGGWNTVKGPGTNRLHYRDGYVPNWWSNNYYPYANYGYGVYGNGYTRR